MIPTLDTLLVDDHPVAGELCGDGRLTATAARPGVHQPDPFHQIRLGGLSGGRAGRVAFGA